MVRESGTRSPRAGFPTPHLLREPPRRRKWSASLRAYLQPRAESLRRKTQSNPLLRAAQSPVSHLQLLAGSGLQNDPIRERTQVGRLPQQRPLRRKPTRKLVQLGPSPALAAFEPHDSVQSRQSSSAQSPRLWLPTVAQRHRDRHRTRGRGPRAGQRPSRCAAGVFSGAPP